MSDTLTLIPANELQPGDMIDFEGDPIVDRPDHCMACGEPATWKEAGGWLHADVEQDYDHAVVECPRDVSLDFEYVQVYRAYTPETFDLARMEERQAGRSDWASGLLPAVRPRFGQVALHLTDDTWIFLPTFHECKVAERQGPEAVED